MLCTALQLRDADLAKGGSAVCGCDSERSNERGGRRRQLFELSGAAAGGRAADSGERDEYDCAVAGDSGEHRRVSQ